MKPVKTGGFKNNYNYF